MRKFLLLVIFTAPVLYAVSQEVIKEELFKVNRDSIEFLNYEGPHKKIESAGEIRGIGEALGRGLGDDKMSGKSDYFTKYSITHVIDGDGTGKLNADIFSIEKGATVDHIDNIRRILKGYLMAYYGYPEEDAKTIAEFITYYNAFYRKNMDYFSKVYSPKVIDQLDPEKAGISTRYTEWPGNTQMLIPLTPTAGAAGNVNLDTISNKDVVEDLRTREDKGIEPRKDMVEVKDREITQEKKKLEEDKAALEEEKQAISEKEAAGVPEEQLAEEKAAADEKEKEIAAREAAVKEKETALQNEREQIVKDEKQIIASKTGSTAKAAGAGGESALVPFLYVESESPSIMGRFVLVDKKTGIISRKSSVNTIRGRRFILSGDSIIFISGIDKAPKAVRLMLMNKNTLKIEKEGENDIYGNSDLLYYNGTIFAVARDGDKWYAAGFDTDLKLISKSKVEVAPFTPLEISEDKLYVQLSSGEIKPLDIKTLAVSTQKQ